MQSPDLGQKSHVWLSACWTQPFSSDVTPLGLSLPFIKRGRDRRGRGESGGRNRAIQNAFSAPSVALRAEAFLDLMYRIITSSRHRSHSTTASPWARPSSACSFPKICVPSLETQFHGAGLSSGSLPPPPAQKRPTKRTCPVNIC